MSILDQTILERNPIRKFLPRPVPREIVDEALALAQQAPSKSNIQPWRVVFASGATRNRLKDALFKVADHEAPHVQTRTSRPTNLGQQTAYRPRPGREARRVPRQRIIREKTRTDSGE